MIAQHPDVSEVAVYGIPDEVAGEVPAALIVLASSTRPSDADLRDFCRERMPAYQVPVSFTVADALPRNESGKLMRGELASRIGGPLGAGMDSGHDASRPQP